ncbi:6007_t:CDS:2 [Entrophospora sp. SA101]|nr:6007_t:CDS:2 [Entrophospora sp. SA101]
MKPIKEPLTSSNFIHIGIPAEINFPSANIKETIVGVFHIFNPKDNPVSWSLKPASVATFRRLGTSTTAAIKLDEEVFSVRRPSGYLKAKNAVRVDVHFLPTGVGTYMQTFVLEDAADGEATSAVGMKFQGIATENTFSALLQKKRLPRKELKFEVEGTELKMPPTRIGRQRTMGIKIINVSKESIRLNCKCETISGPGGKFVLSIAMNTVIVKADGFAVILVRFQPKTSGEVKGVVTIQSLGSAEVKVDVIAKGIRETPIISKVSQSLQTNDDLPEMKPIKEPLTSSNFIHIGIPAEINFPSANIKETIVGVFHIFNPKDNPVSWSLKPASVATFRRLGTSTTAAIKLDEEVFSVRRPSGYLKAKNAVRVDVHFLPTGVGTYMQTFVLEDAADGEATSAVGMKFQGIATENTFSALLQKKRLPRKELKFEVEGTELKMPPTRIGRQRTMGIKIINVSKESIRLNCKCETISGPGGKFVLSIAMNTVIVKADGFAVILVRFQPKTSGEVKGVVTIQSLGSAEVKVDVIAKGIRENILTLSLKYLNNK